MEKINLMDCRLYYEYGHICVRTQNGELLYTVHFSEIDNCTGISLGIIKECITAHIARRRQNESRR